MNTVYLDNAATTRVSEKAAAEAVRVMRELYANPSSAHAFGFEAEKLLKASREKIVKALGFSRGDGTLLFVSCGTEADNTALFGAAETLQKRGKRVVISDSEHPAVENAAKKLEQRGFRVERVPTRGGRLDLDFAEQALGEDVILVSCMTVNNETGALYDLRSLAALARRKAPRALIHTDAVQAFTKVRDLASPGADLISISGHKIHAPKGIGALWIRSGVRLTPMLYGGGQEDGLRSGTEALPGIAAFAVAAEDAMDRFAERDAHFKALNAYAREAITKIESAVINSGREGFAPHILSIAFPGLRSEVLLRFLSARGIFVSAGSACSSKHADNRVLAAFGLDALTADGTLRVSFSEENTADDIDRLCEGLEAGVKSLAGVGKRKSGR